MKNSERGRKKEGHGPESVSHGPGSVSKEVTIEARARQRLNEYLETPEGTTVTLLRKKVDRVMREWAEDRGKCPPLRDTGPAPRLSFSIHCSFGLIFLAGFKAGLAEWLHPDQERGDKGRGSKATSASEDTDPGPCLRKATEEEEFT